MRPFPPTALDFWNENEYKQDQMLYAAFCLLESGISNFVAGRFLRKCRVFDWATTSFYYSALYSIRLVVFLGYGDFPEGHRKIGAMFKNGSVKDRAWLLSFLKSLQGYTPSRHYPYFDQNPKNVLFERDLLESSLSMNGVDLSALREAFDFFEKIFTEATDLRNDSSYESLLVAHQYSHVKVTQCFEDLVDNFEKLSKKAIDHALRIFQEFVAAHTRHDYFCAFLMDEKNREGFYYLESSPQNKGYSSEMIEAALDLLTTLKKMSIKDDKKAGSFHTNISMQTFDVKRELMQDFDERVKKFGNLLSP
jgi:hypothetical protein